MKLGGWGGETEGRLFREGKLPGPPISGRGTAEGAAGVPEDQPRLAWSGELRSSFLLVGDDVFQWTNPARGLIIEPPAYLGRFETGSRDGLAGSVEDPARLIHVHRTSR